MIKRKMHFKLFYFFKDAEWFNWVYFYKQQKKCYCSIQLSIKFLTLYSRSFSIGYISMSLFSTPPWWNLHHTETLVTTCQTVGTRSAELQLFLIYLFTFPLLCSKGTQRGTKPMWDKKYRIMIGNFLPNCQLHNWELKIKTLF